MSNRKSYFVSISKQEITDISIPGSNGFEIKATDDDIVELNRLFNKKDDHGTTAVEYLAKPFNEWGADDERDEFESYLMSVYRKLYELGTNETREQIKTMDINL